MNKEYESIRSKTIEIALDSAGAEINAGTVIDAVRAAVESCYKLASKPPKDLTGDEKYDLWLSCYGGKFSRDDFRCESGSEVVDNIIAAFLEKQREPQVVKFRAAMNKESGAIEMLRDGNSLPTAWCFLEPAQEFEVRT